MSADILDSFDGIFCQCIADITGVDCGGGFEEQDVDFLFSDRFVLYTAGNDEEFAALQGDILVSEFDHQAAFEYQEHLILGIVFVPGELAFELGEFDNLVIELANQPGAPVFVDQIKFFVQVDFLHRFLSFLYWSMAGIRL